MIAYGNIITSKILTVSVHWCLRYKVVMKWVHFT